MDTTITLTEVAELFPDHDLLAENAQLQLDLTEARYDLVRAEQRIQELERLALTDKLTGLPNRRAAEEAIEREFARCRRDSCWAALLMVDVDHFKAFNDQHGHAVGDQVLRAVAQAAPQAFRKTDTFARWGGEEFIGVIGDLDPEQAEYAARCAAEKLRGQIELMEVQGLTVTVSVGVTISQDGLDWERRLNRADEALYAAKNAGRNRVEIA